MHGVVCHGRLLGADGEVLEYECKSKDGITGSAMIHGQSFDLQRGGFFLVAREGKTFRIQQLTRDLTAVQFHLDGLRRMAAEDEKIKQFFSNEEPASSVAVKSEI
jgi:c-di-GMP-binding flagellar brake protein YcgR